MAYKPALTAAMKMLQLGGVLQTHTKITTMASFVPV